MSDEHDNDCPHCGESIEDVIHGLKTALEKTREERSELKEKLDKVKGERDALDPDGLQLALDALKASSVPKEDFEALTAELETSTATVTELKSAATDGKIATAVAKERGNLAMLSPMIRAKLEENPDLDLGEHLAALKLDADFAGAFRASEHSGGGSDPGKGGDAISRTIIDTANLRRGTMSDKEKNEYQKTHGLDALLDLPM